LRLMKHVPVVDGVCKLIIFAGSQNKATPIADNMAAMMSLV
jgi:hypothetical protein